MSPAASTTDDGHPSAGEGLSTSAADGDAGPASKRQRREAEGGEEGGEAEDAVNQDAAARGLADLPDEVLEEVLALTQDTTWADAGAQGLLRLRRVCKRWDRLIRSPGAWRYCEVRMCKPQAGLRLLPRIPRLHVTAYKDARGPAVLKALLAAHHCQVDFLKLTFEACDKDLVKLVVDVLLARQQTLQGLDLEMSVCYKKVDTSKIYAAADGCSKLEEFRIGNSSRGGGNLNYAFRGLTALRRLTVRNNVRPELVDSLLEASKDTLTSVYLGREVKLRATLVRCTGLRQLSLEPQPGLDLLHQLARLDVLTVTCRGVKKLRLFVNYLKQAPAEVPRRVRLTLDFIEPKFTLRQAAPSLGRVCYLSLNGHVFISWKSFLECLHMMPHLEELSVQNSWSSRDNNHQHGIDFNALVGSWTEETVPKLRKLYVSGSDDPDWVEELKEMRPKLAAEFQECC